MSAAEQIKDLGNDDVKTYEWIFMVAPVKVEFSSGDFSTNKVSLKRKLILTTSNTYTYTIKKIQECIKFILHI